MVYSLPPVAGTGPHQLFSDEVRKRLNILSGGSILQFGPSSIANGSYLNIQPSSGVEIEVRNVFFPATIELHYYDGTNDILFDASASFGGLYIPSFKCSNTKYVRVKNVSGSTQFLYTDAVVDVPIKQFGPTSISADSYLDLQPTSGEVEIHNIYYAGPVEFYVYDGTNLLGKFDEDTSVSGGSTYNLRLACTNSTYVRVKNKAATAKLIAADGVIRS